MGPMLVGAWVNTPGPSWPLLSAALISSTVRVCPSPSPVTPGNSCINFFAGLSFLNSNCIDTCLPDASKPFIVKLYWWVFAKKPSKPIGPRITVVATPVPTDVLASPDPPQYVTRLAGIEPNGDITSVGVTTIVQFEPPQRASYWPAKAGCNAPPFNRVRPAALTAK